MKGTIVNEDPCPQADTDRSDRPQVKRVWHRKLRSIGFSGWRRMGVRLVLLRAKRRAKQVR